MSSILLDAGRTPFKITPHAPTANCDDATTRRRDEIRATYRTPRSLAPRFARGGKARIRDHKLP
jgi:hypothetical protein